MASPTRWAWVWVNSRNWWWIGRPGMLQFMGSQRVTTEWLNWLIYCFQKHHLTCTHLWSRYACVCAYLITQLCPTLWNPMDCKPPGFSLHGNSPGRSTGVGCHAFFQGIFPAQGSNADLPHCRQILYCLSQQRSPRILEWVAYPFSRGSSWHRNRTGASCIAGGFFTSWADTREAPHRYNLTQMSDDKYLWGTYCPYLVFPFWETPIRVNAGHFFISLQPHH